MLTISKSGGKVVKSDMTITKNFMINVRFVSLFFMNFRRDFVFYSVQSRFLTFFCRHLRLTVCATRRQRLSSQGPRIMEGCLEDPNIRPGATHPAPSISICIEEYMNVVWRFIFCSSVVLSEQRRRHYISLKNSLFSSLYEIHLV